MARNRFVITTEGQVALDGSNPQTLLQILVPADLIIAVKGFTVSFDGTTVTNAPVEVTLGYGQSDALGMSSATAVRESAHTISSQCTVTKTAGNATEPTGTVTKLRSYLVHPQTGLEVRFSPEDELLYANGRLALVANAPNAVEAVGALYWEE